MTVMGIRKVHEPFIKWWKLILVACLLAGFAAYLVVSRRVPEYRTSAYLVIGAAVQPNPTGDDLDLGRRLAAYFAAVAQDAGFRDGVRRALKLGGTLDRSEPLSD